MRRKIDKALNATLVALLVLLATQTLIYAQCPQQFAPGHAVTSYTYIDPSCSNFGHNSNCYYVQCNSDIACGSIQPPYNSYACWGFPWCVC